MEKRESVPSSWHRGEREAEKILERIGDEAKNLTQKKKRASFVPNKKGGKKERSPSSIHTNLKRAVLTITFKKKGGHRLHAT